MTEESSNPAESLDHLQFKLPELNVSSEQPWQDDQLGREQIAERLTNLIRDQREPFIISIDGQWGSGKTFLLKRWQKDLEKDKFPAIYYNAWEDDFCDDPLLSIIGQMSEQFKEGKFKELAKQVGQIAVQLIKQNLIAVPSKLTGLELSVDLSRLDGRDLLQEYSNQRKTKDSLKNKLTQLSVAVAKETERPLVFIIDELDRCRPTFAIELLERIKHIFDVPGLVFVFGVNRAEICKSLQSVYGDIDADVYLRRFFDMEFMLPEADSEKFCTQIMTRFGLHELFLSTRGKPRARKNSSDFDNFSHALPVLCACLGLSLRDIVYCMGIVVLAIRNLEGDKHMYPWLLSLLIPLRLNNQSLYRQFILGERRAQHVMDYIDNRISHPKRDRQLDFELNVIEAELYRVEGARLEDTGESSPWAQLNLLHEDPESTNNHLLSRRTQAADSDRVSELLRLIGNESRLFTPRTVLEQVARLIDLHTFVRR